MSQVRAFMPRNGDSFEAELIDRWYTTKGVHKDIVPIAQSQRQSQ